jgi:site-specific recombinase XerD
VETSAAIERFLSSPALSDATRRAYRADLHEFSEWLRENRLTLQEVDARALARYAAKGAP